MIRCRGGSDMRAGYGLGLLLLAGTSGAMGAPIDILDVYHFRDIRSANRIGIAEGDQLTMGVYMTPNPRTGDSGTTIVASQNGTQSVVSYLNSPASPNEYSDSVPFSAALTGQWQLTISNPTSTNTPQIAYTPTVLRANGTIAGTQQFVQNMAISGVGSFALSFQAPAGSMHDRISVRIFEVSDHSPPRLVHVKNDLPASATSYAIPFILNGDMDTLIANQRYAVSIELDERRSDNSLLSKSRSIFEFTPIPNSFPNLYIPIVTQTGVYTFNVTNVGGKTIYIDPFVSIGYDYTTGTGDPNFASVILPMIGDGIFDLFLFDGTDYVFAQKILAGEEFFFDQTGVDRFRILGIEVEAGLDPADVTAFITGLTFTGDGDFTGSMTPITQYVPDPSPVPEPASLLLFTSCVLGLTLARQRRPCSRA